MYDRHAAFRCLRRCQVAFETGGGLEGRLRVASEASSARLIVHFTRFCPEAWKRLLCLLCWYGRLGASERELQGGELHVESQVLVDEPAKGFSRQVWPVLAEGEPKGEGPIEGSAPPLSKMQPERGACVLAARLLLSSVMPLAHLVCLTFALRANGRAESSTLRQPVRRPATRPARAIRPPTYGQPAALPARAVRPPRPRPARRRALARQSAAPLAGPPPSPSAPCAATLR